MTQNELESFRSEAHSVLGDYKVFLSQIKTMHPVLDKEGIDHLFDDLQDLERHLSEFDDLVQVSEIDDETFIQAKEQISKIKRVMGSLRDMYL